MQFHVAYGPCDIVLFYVLQSFSCTAFEYSIPGISLSPCLVFSVCLSVCLSVSVSVSLCLFLSVCLSVCLSVSLPPSLYFSLFLHSFVETILLDTHTQWNISQRNTSGSLIVRHIVQELCESRGGRPGLSVPKSLLVSVDVKIY